MFTIALIQNQSEMAHYGYADARPLIRELGYIPVLYTADNIDTLGNALSRNQYDAIIFASNALNDKTIKEEVESEKFILHFHAWLKSNNGRGCLCLHQLRLATENNSSLKFLPESLNKINAKIRPKNEKSADGKISYSSNAENNTLLLYPTKIIPEKLQKRALNFKSLPGLYWHYWSEVNLTDWEILLTDKIEGDSPRALVVVTRNSDKGRIVASTLTLDWQKQRSILQNILTYVVEGKHNTAFLSDENNRNTAFDYLIGTLQSRKYPFRSYFLGQELTELEQHILNGVHTILVLGPFVELPKLSSSLLKMVVNNVQRGNLKLISIDGSDPEIRKFSVAGRERSALRLLNKAELQIQSELRTGYVDGSFWSTAETLQILKDTPQSTSNYKSLIGEALKLASTHDRDGSYDEVFGVTCAYLWMRKTYLNNLKEVEATVQWIRYRIGDYETREQVQAYLMFASLNIITDPEKEKLSNILVQISSDQLSEIDIIVYLKSSVISKYHSVTPTLISQLKKLQQENGAWVDLATTATAISTLIDVLEENRSESSFYAQLKPNIETMIFRGIIYIQNSLQHSTSNELNQSYPWDGKASTTVKCIQAWFKFEELIDLPVNELVETLSKYDVQLFSLRAGSQALNILEDLKKDNNNLSQSIKATVNKYELANKLAKRSRIYLLGIFIASYLSASFFYGLVKTEALPAIINVFKVGFIDSWGVHLAAIGSLGAILAVPWKKIFKDEIQHDEP